MPDLDTVLLNHDSDDFHYVMAPSVYGNGYRLPARLDALAESVMIGEPCNASLGSVVSELSELPRLPDLGESRSYLAALAATCAPFGIDVLICRNSGDRELFTIVRRAHDVATAAIALDSRSMRVDLPALAVAMAELAGAVAALVPPDFVPIIPTESTRHSADSDPAESLIGSD